MRTKYILIEAFIYDDIKNYNELAYQNRNNIYSAKKLKYPNNICVYFEPNGKTIVQENSLRIFWNPVIKLNS